MVQKLIISLLATFVFVGCSKTTPHIETKERVIEKETKTYSALKASDDLILQNEENLNTVIEQVRQKRSPGFQWEVFWLRVSDRISTLKLSKGAVENLFSLSSMTCSENPLVAEQISRYALSGLSESVKSNLPMAPLWYKALGEVRDSCHLNNDATFTFLYMKGMKEVFEYGDKELQLLLLVDLNQELTRSSNKLLLKEARKFLNDSDGLIEFVKSSLTLPQNILLAKSFKKIFPYKENPFFEEILNDSSASPASVLEVYSDNNDALSTLTELDIPIEKISDITAILISKFSDKEVLSGDDEKQNHFLRKYHQADMVFSILEDELSKTQNKKLVLGKLESLYRSLESRYFNLSRPDDFIFKHSGPLAMLLDLRLAKKTRQSTLLNSKNISSIKKLKDVIHLFHFMHKNQNVAGISTKVSLYCSWIGIEAIETLKLNSLKNGCSAFDKVGVKKIEKDRVIMPLFSILKMPAELLRIKALSLDASIIDLSNLETPKASHVAVETLVEPIVFPLIVGVELKNEFLDLEKNKLYYFPLHYIYRGPLNGLDHDESHSSNGIKGGDLSLSVNSLESSFRPTFISEGGNSAEPLSGRQGGKEISYTIDAYNVEDWLMLSGEGEMYPLHLLSAKNLDKLFDKLKRNSSNKVVVKMDPAYLEKIGPVAQKVFSDSLQLARGSNSFLATTYFEQIANEGLQYLKNEISRNIENGNELKTLPALSPSFHLKGGTIGRGQEPGLNGVNGSLVYE